MTWREYRVKDAADITNGHPFDATQFSERGELALVRIRDLVAPAFTAYVPRESAPEGVLLNDGDIVIGMDGDFNAVLWRRGEAALNQRLCALRTNPSFDRRFLAYLLPAPLKAINDLTYSTTVKHLSSKQIADIRFSAPDAVQQGRIADYLDRETAQIDALIAKQEQLIATLRERRDAAWAETFVQAQTQFGTTRLRRLVDSITDGPFGSSLTSKHYTDSGARVVRLGNIGVNEFRASDQAWVSLGYYEVLKPHSVRAGDVVVAGLGDERMPLGRAAVVPEIGPAIVKADCYRIRPAHRVRPEYLAWALSSPPVREQFRLMARGSTRSRLNTTVVLEAHIPAPPLGAQDEIVSQSASALASIDTLIAKAERFIELSKERRAALITAAVTGQLEIPG